MPKQMWFGNEKRFQWVPAPSTMMGVSSVGTGDSLEYQNGRIGITRTMQTHKVYDMEFPIQEASGLTGLDVFQKFASGFYGDCDTYPLFFADPMNYDQNLFPPHWASPGLFARGWAGIVESSGKLYNNLALNPSVEVNTNGYSANAGTGGVVTTARTSAGPQVGGVWSYRVTWTTATTAVGGGIDYTGTPVQKSTNYDFWIHVTTSVAQRVQVTIRWRDGGGVSLGTVTGTQTVLAANTATKLSVLGATSHANAVTADIEVRAVSGTSGVNWAVGNWMQADAVMINFTNYAPTTYFDGDTPGAGWAGVPHASRSYKYTDRVVPTITDTPANTYNLPPVRATYNVTTVANAYPGQSTIEIPYAIIPIPPGYTLWLGATGSATGTAQVAVYLYNTPASFGSPAGTAALTLLSESGATRLNASFSGTSYQYAKVFIRRTSLVASTITLSSMIAQLWPTGYTPVTTGNFIEGKGHRGLKFAAEPTVESYVIVDPNRNIPIHYKGMSTQLIEAQDRG